MFLQSSRPSLSYHNHYTGFTWLLTDIASYKFNPLHIIFPSPFHFLPHTLVNANTLFLVCSERSNSKSTCGLFFFLCLRPRAPKHCLRSPPSPHFPITPPAAPYNSLPLFSLLMNFSLERSLNIYQTTLFQLYPQDPSLPDGKLKAGHLFKVFNFMKIMQKGFPDVFHGTYQR